MLEFFTGQSTASVIHSSFIAWAIRSIAIGIATSAVLAAILVLVGWQPTFDGLRFLAAFSVGLALGLTAGHFLHAAEYIGEASE